MKTKQDAYDAAQAVDRSIDRWLAESPITKENWANWFIFARTLGTSLNLIQEEIERVRRED